MSQDIELSIVIPALNEEKTIGICIKQAFQAMKKLGIDGEVIVADNGSRDQTKKIAEKLEARVVSIPRQGYGTACLGGFRAARGKFIIMGDADDSYHFSEIGAFYDKLKEGYDLVMGNRFRGKIEQGAMPLLHRYLGTPILTAIMNLFFKTGIGDTNCGMRGLTKKSLGKMRLKNGGMEFATEMIVKASLVGLKIAEVPCNLYQDKRNRKPHLNTWLDGWRHLRFMLLFTPTWTFLVPGTFLALAGLSGMIFLTARDFFHLNIFSAIGQKHMISCMLVALSGYQIIQLGLIAKTFSFSKHFDYSSQTMLWLNRYFNLEKGLALGFTLIFAGIAIFIYLQISFYTNLFPRLSDPIRFDIAIFTAASFLLGIQFFFSSFVLSLFYLKVK